MSVQLEAPIEKGVVKWAREHDWLVVKLWAFNQVGLPDRLFIYYWPTIIFMEFKKPGGKLHPLQDRWKKMLALRGFLWYTVEQVENGIHILKGAMDSQRVPKDRDSIPD